MRQMRPQVSPPLQRLAAQLNEHGAKDDLMESRRAFARSASRISRAGMILPTATGCPPLRHPSSAASKRSIPVKA